MQPMTMKISALIYFVLFTIAPALALYLGPFALIVIPALLFTMWHNEEQEASFWMEEVSLAEGREGMFEKAPKYGLTEEVARMMIPQEVNGIAYLCNEDMVVACCEAIYRTGKQNIGQDAAWAMADKVWDAWEAAKAAGMGIIQVYVQAGQVVVRPINPWALAH